MIKRIILGILFVSSLLWVGYTFYKNYQEGAPISFQNAFNSSDETVLIINRTNEFSSEIVADWSEYLSKDWLEFAHNDIIEQVAFSKKQNKTLWKFKKPISQTILKPVFGDQAQFNLGEIQSIKGQKVWTHDRYLLISKDKQTETNEEIYFDQKSTAAVINFLPNNQNEVTDIYLKEGGIIEYLHANSTIESKKINDAEQFAYVIPNSIESYWFQEKNHAIQNDSILKNSPMAQWLNVGFVQFDFLGEKIILTDYLDGNDPQFVLSNIENSADTNWFSTPLTKNFPNGTNYVIKPVEDFMLFSENEEICDQFIANYKLGKTLALTPESFFQFYGKLPQLVSERFISKDQKWSQSTYDGKILTTALNSGDFSPEIKQQDILSMTVNFSIKNFETLKGIGNAVVTGSDGEIAAFLNQKLAWSKKIDKIQNLQIIDFLGNGKQQILIATDKKIHLFDKKGNNVNGFPIQSEDLITAPPKFYRWKGAPFVLVATEKNEILQFDSRGRERFVWNCGSTIEKPIQVWASQKMLFWGIQNSNEFKMYHVENQKTHRTFPLKENAVAIKIPNELIHFQKSGNQFERVDQKGTALGVQSLKKGSILNTNENENVVTKQSNEISIFNTEGIPFSNFRIPFNEFSSVQTLQRRNGNTLISVLDELENNIYLYSSKGNQLFGKSFEGKTKVALDELKGKLIVTSIVDEFLVQYILN